MAFGRRQELTTTPTTVNRCKPAARLQLGWLIERRIAIRQEEYPAAGCERAWDATDVTSTHKLHCSSSGSSSSNNNNNNNTAAA